MRRWAVTVVSTASIAVGCAIDERSATGDSAADPGPLELTCGTGDTAFVPLTDGMDLTMVHGPGGGWWLSTAISAVSSERNVALLPIVTLPAAADLQISSASPPGDFVALAIDPQTRVGTYVGLQARLDPWAVDANDPQGTVCSWDGATLRLRMELTNLLDGRAASCEHDIVARADTWDHCATR